MEVKHYVYAHLKDGVIRYVGVGRNSEISSNYYRANNFYNSARTKQWLEVFKDEQPDVVIIEDGLSYLDSVYLENYLFHSCRDTIINITEPRPSREMDFELFNEWFYVDPTSYSGLRLKKKDRNNSRTNVGDAVGTKTTPGASNKIYWRVKIAGKAYLAHRVIYLLTHGTIDRHLVINHIDGNGLNNDISNLEEVTHSTNSYKKSIRKDNTTRHHGISFTKYKGKVDGYLSKFRKKSQRFSAIVFGNLEEALASALRWKSYQELKDGVYQASEEDFLKLEKQVYLDAIKIQSVRIKPEPFQMKNGTWYVKFKYKNTDEKYTCLSGYSSKEEIEKERDRLISEYNSKIVVQI